MARKSVTVNIPEDPENRDGGKRFIITELPASQGEKWGARALNALLASGIEIPDTLAKQGLRGVAAAGIDSLSGFTGIPWHLAEPLLDEMMKCVQIDPDPINRPGVNIRPLIESDIEEIKTRLTLRNAWLELHIGFSFAAKTQTSDLAAGE
jgi:hypothetical protein